VTRRGLLGLLAAGLGASVLSACGRKGKPEVPDDAIYPNVYPYTPYPAQKGKTGTATGAKETPPIPVPQTDKYR